jgi:hypothetical protein
MEWLGIDTVVQCLHGGCSERDMLEQKWMFASRNCTHICHASIIKLITI